MLIIEEGKLKHTHTHRHIHKRSIAHSNLQAMPLLDLRLRQEEQLLSHISKIERRQANPPGLASSKFEKEFQASVCLLLVELCEKFTFYGIVCNMLLFCTIKLGYHNYEAAMLNVCFAGACTVAPVLMGWLAEHPVGRNRLVYLCTLLHFIGRYHFLGAPYGSWQLFPNVDGVHMMAL